MLFESSCCCPLHREWKHGEVRSEQLRQCNREENRWLEEFFGSNTGRREKEKFVHHVNLGCKSNSSVENSR